MRIVERFPATGFFTGERRLLLRGVPLGAKVRAARFVISPVRSDGTPGIEAEVLHFLAGDAAGTDDDDPDRATGVFKTRATGAARPWVEATFQDRRIADRVDAVDLTGHNLGGATLQVDLGGVFVEINADGALLANGDDAFALPAPFPDGGAALPGVASTRIKLTSATAAAVDFDRLHLRAVAANLRLSIGGETNAFVRPGELVTEVETPDLARMLQIAVDAAEDPGTGYAEIPLALTVDGTGRIALAAAIDVETAADVLGPDLAEASLDFGYDGVAPATDDLLKIRVPAGMQVAPGGTSVELVGRFEGTEVVKGTLVERSPPASVPLRAGAAFAQPLTLAADVEFDALDVMVSTPEPASRIELDLRGDLDGKPAAESVLPGVTTLDVTDARHARPAWASARLPRAVKLAALGRGGRRNRWWLVVTVLAGEVGLAVGEAAAPDPVPPQSSGNGGLSWRAAEIAGAVAVAAPEARFRLRRQSPSFSVPLRVELGRDSLRQEIDLDAFQPLGRVDFVLDGARIAGAANRVLDDLRAGACPRGEQLANGGFLDRAESEGGYAPADWTASGGLPEVWRIGSAGFPLVNALIVVIVGEEPRSLSQVLVARAGCAYELTVTGFAAGPEATAELVWRSAGCGAIRVDVLRPVPFDLGELPDIDVATGELPVLAASAIPRARLRVVAPEGTTGLELRLRAAEATNFVIDSVSLLASPQELANPDFLEIEALGFDGALGEALPGWTVSPADVRLQQGLELDLGTGVARLHNDDSRGRTVTLTQVVAARPDADATLTLEAVVELAVGAEAPAVSLAWHDASGADAGRTLRAPLLPDGGVVRLAVRVPATAATASLGIDLPFGVRLGLVELTFRQDPATPVPLSFLSEAPGNLTVRNFRVAFEPAPEPPRPTPEGGLCGPTPADQAPGDDCEADPSCTCRKPDRPAPALPARLAVARPAGLVSFSDRVAFARGRSVATGRLDRTLDPRLAVPRSAFVEPAGAITDVAEVGEARAAALASLGIVTPRLLAGADPALLTARLGFPPRLAENLVENARALVARRGGPRG